jgi:hypothetical protein
MRPLVRLFIDAGDGPLWISSDDDEGPREPDDFPFTPELRDRLTAWHEWWLREYDDDLDRPRWRSGPARGAEWVAEGHRLARLVQDELGPDDDVRFVGRP